MEHPITPPPELVEQWRTTPEYVNELSEGMLVGMTTSKLQEIAVQSARWGADKELEACCEWLDFYAAAAEARDLRAARRPKPPSLKEQALESLNKIEDNKATYLDSSIIRRALESIPDSQD